MKQYLIVFLLVVCTGATIYAQADLQPVALVRLTRSEPITVKQLKTEIEKLAWQSLIARLGRIPTDAELNREVLNTSIESRRQVLEVIINEKLALQAAERDRITVTDNEINQQITQLKTQMAQAIGRLPTDDELSQAIKNETGQDLNTFRESLRRQAIVQKYLMSKKQDLFNELKPPSDAEIINFYNLAKSQFVRPDTVRFSMIQVAYGGDAVSKTRAKELADRLSREIGTNPSSFDEVVVRGQNPNSGYRAGDGGYLPRSVEAQARAGADFINTAFSLKQGEVSRVIEGIQGYQIIKITETYTQKALELDDVAELGSRITVRQFIGANMMQQKQQEILARASQELIRELRTGNPFQVMENNLNF